MKKKALNKLRSRAGETIAETLISVLIGALALTMLAGAISAASNMITKSETVMKTYYESNEALGNPAKGGMTVALDSGSVKLFPDTTNIVVDWDYNGTFANTPVVAYKAHEQPGGGATP